MKRITLRILIPNCNNERYFLILLLPWHQLGLGLVLSAIPKDPLSFAFIFLSLLLFMNHFRLTIFIKLEIRRGHIHCSLLPVRRALHTIPRLGTPLPSLGSTDFKQWIRFFHISSRAPLWHKLSNCRATFYLWSTWDLRLEIILTVVKSKSKT